METWRLSKVSKVLKDLKELEIELKDNLEQLRNDGYDLFATHTQEEWVRVKKAINALEDR